MEKNNRLVFLTRPVAPPWDEASMNLAVNIATHLRLPGIQCILLTTKAKIPNLPPHVSQEPIHTTKALTLWSKLKIVWYVLVYDVNYMHAIFVFTPLTGIIINILKALKGFRVVQTISSLPKNTLFLRYAVFGDEVVCFSKMTAKKLIDLDIKPHIIPPAVPTQVFKPGKKQPIIAFLGELYRQKNFAIVETLVDLISRSLPDYNVVLGFRTTRKPREEQQLVSLLKQKYKNNERILFSDVITDMPNFLRRTKLVIFPATRVTEKFDYPLVLLESLAAGCPIIISKIGPLAELTKYPGVIAPSENTAHAFLTAIEMSLGAYEKLSADARITATKNFNIMTAVKQYEKLYQKILL